MTEVRDIMGINPLYWYDGRGGRVYGVSLRELFDKGVPRKLSREGLRSYLEYGCVYEPLTLVKDVYAVWPGTVERGELGVGGWELGEESFGVGGEGWELRVEDRVREGVEKAIARAMPERPAAYLSGGIDSSAVVAVMRRLTKEPIDTFCVIHEDPKCDEREWARMVAKANGTRHHELLLTPTMIKENIRQALGDYDQPSLDGINNWFAAKMVKDLGFDVVLSGNGGDELFIGYDNFAKQRMACTYGRYLRHFPRALGRFVERLGSNEKVKKLGMLMGCVGDPYFQTRRIFSNSMIDRLCPLVVGLTHVHKALHSHLSAELSTLNAQPSTLNPQLSTDLLNRLSWLELRTSVLSMYLRDGWNMARAHGVEVRSPLLDPELVRVMMSIRGATKIGEVSKHLLVKAAGEGLPMACVTRPKKGFGLPFDLYFRDALKGEMEAFRAGELWDGLDKRVVQKLWSDYEAGKVWWTRIWGLFVLSYWLKSNQVEI